MQHPQGLYAGGDKILVADTYNNAIREYDLKTGALSTWPLAKNALEEPGDVVVIGDKTYIADTGHNRIVIVNKAAGKVDDFTLTFRE